MIRPLLVASSLLLAGCQTSTTRPLPAEQKSGGKLTAAYHVQPICNGITTTRDGRVFVCFPRPDGGGAASVCELLPGDVLKPYPDVTAHTWKIGDRDAADKIVRANSIRVGPDGLLWVVDIGSPAGDTRVVPGGPKLVGIDTTTNKVVKTFLLDDAVKPKSFVDDVRFGNRMIYLTDAGEPAMIVLDPTTGRARRVLEKHYSVVARDIRAEGKLLVKPSGEKVATHADQLEVNADGSILYYMPCSGPSYQIETKFMDDENLSDEQLATYVRPFFDNPTIGGTCIDAAGNVYFNDVDQQRILKVTPAGKSSVLVQDKLRLHWGDALWLGDDGTLYIPAAQINRSPGMNRAIDAVNYPVTIFTMKTGATPVRR